MSADNASSNDSPGAKSRRVGFGRRFSRWFSSELLEESKPLGRDVLAFDDEKKQRQTQELQEEYRSWHEDDDVVNDGLSEPSRGRARSHGNADLEEELDSSGAHSSRGRARSHGNANLEEELDFPIDVPSGGGRCRARSEADPMGDDLATVCGATACGSHDNGATAEDHDFGSDTPLDGRRSRSRSGVHFVEDESTPDDEAAGRGQGRSRTRSGGGNLQIFGDGQCADGSMGGSSGDMGATPSVDMVAIRSVDDLMRKLESSSFANVWKLNHDAAETVVTGDSVKEVEQLSDIRNWRHRFLRFVDIGSHTELHLISEKANIEDTIAVKVSNEDETVKVLELPSVMLRTLSPATMRSHKEQAHLYDLAAKPKLEEMSRSGCKEGDEPEDSPRLYRMQSIMDDVLIKDSKLPEILYPFMVVWRHETAGEKRLVTGAISRASREAWVGALRMHLAHGASACNHQDGDGDSESWLNTVFRCTGCCLLSRPSA